MASTHRKSNYLFLHKCRKFLTELGLFLILLLLPIITIGVAFYNIQQKVLDNSVKHSLDEMAEITAHMQRLTEPKTYYQESLRRLAESFKWYENIEEVPRIGEKELLDLALFDENGNRLKWPANENLIKTKVSQDYIQAIKRLSSNPDAPIQQEDSKTSIMYSGNSETLSSLANNPNTLVNFQGLGLRKMGGWFKIQLPLKENETEKKYGDLIAWLDLQKLGKYTLAEKTIATMQKLASSEYTFSYIDLNDIEINKSSNNRRFKNPITKILSSNSLKSGFIYENELFSISDTQEGLRLICSKPCPKPIKLIETYKRILFIIVPVVFLLFIWAKIFKVKISFSINLQAALTFGFAAIIGIIAILISNTAYQYEKQESVTQKYKNEAIEILEKVDQQYSDSFDDLLVQYRHFKEELLNSNRPAEEILSPLIKAQKEEVIAYAVYVDHTGKIVFQAPDINSIQFSNIASRYGRLVNRLAIQSLKTFNSSRSEIQTESESPSIQVFTTTAVEGLLSGRSKFIETKLDNEDTLAFMDFVINKEDFATGCLLIIHEPQKLERHYLNESGVNINNSKDYELIAFPKTSLNPSSYYPRYSYIYEEPLWKLNDIVNQTQLPSFKSGKIGENNVIVAAIPANKMKNYNLFLSMPVDNMGDKALSLSNVLLFGSVFALIFMIILSVIISYSINGPINILKQNAATIKGNHNKLQNIIKYSDSSELESISTGITNLVIKTKEFYEKQNIVKELLPFTPYTDSEYEANIFPLKENDNNSLYYSSFFPEDNTLSVFFIKHDGKTDLTSSLPLSMSGMALKVFIEQQNMRSPSLAIKNLEEFFKINYKMNISANYLSIFLDIETGLLNYYGLGEYCILQCNLTESKIDIIKISKQDKPVEDSSGSLDIEQNIPHNTCFIILSKDISSEKVELLQQILANKTINADNIKEELLPIIHEFIHQNEKIDSLLYISRKQENKTALLNKKLAESNPIALIRSQKTGSQSNA